MVQQVSTVVSGPTLCVTYSRCYQWSNTLRYIFPPLSAVQHFVLHFSTVIIGPTLCVTYLHCYQRSNTVRYIFPLLSAVQHCVLQVFTVISGSAFFCYRLSLLSAVQHCVLHIPTVISGPTLCVIYSHCYRQSNTVCYRFSLLSAVQHFVLHISTVISGPTLCVTGFHCYQWSNTLPASAVKYVCTGSTAILPWTISLSQGEDIVDIRWLFRGHSEEVIAMSNHGTFVALPAYQQKASNVPNAGIALRQVTPSDTGNYSVEVTGRNSNGVQFMLHRSAILQVLGRSWRPVYNILFCRCWVGHGVLCRTFCFAGAG